jgi:hypothetical protein
MNLKRKITFREIHLAKSAGSQIYRILFTFENGKSNVINAFNRLPQDAKDEIKSLITRMATTPNFKSNKIKYLVEGYTFGELKPEGHRFFFFQRCGNNIIIFHYSEKKKNSLGSQVYHKTEELKEYYAQEFERNIQRG